MASSPIDNTRPRKHLDDDLAQRTVCKELARGVACNRRYGCRFSHSLIDTDAIAALGRSFGDGNDVCITLKYQGGFERFGSYDDWGYGWRVEISALRVVKDPAPNFDNRYRSECFAKKMLETTDMHVGTALVRLQAMVDVEEGRTLYKPKSSFLAKTTICKDHAEEECTMGRECAFSHTLLDTQRLTKYFSHCAGYRGTQTFVTIQWHKSISRDPWSLIVEAIADPDLHRLEDSDLIGSRQCESLPQVMKQVELRLEEIAKSLRSPVATCLESG